MSTIEGRKIGPAFSELVTEFRHRKHCVGLEPTLGVVYYGHFANPDQASWKLTRMYGGMISDGDIPTQC